MSAVAPASRARRIAIGAAFALAFGWEFFGAVSNLQFFLGLAAVSRAELSAFAWIVLVGGLAIPVIAYAVGLLAGVRRTPARLALVLLAAFCASEAVTLSVLALFQSAVGVV